MKVLLIGEFSEGKLGRYYARAFSQLGVTVGTYSTEGPSSWLPYLQHQRLLRRAMRSIRWRRMENECLAVASDDWDAIIAIKAPFLSPATVCKIRNLCSKTVMLYPDSPWDRYTQRKRVLPVLSAFLTTFIWSRELVLRLQRCGIRSEYLPFAYDPCDYRAPNSTTVRENSLVFVGQVYRKRIAWLKNLEGLPVKVIGAGWKQGFFGMKSSIRTTSESRMGFQAGQTYATNFGALNILDDKNLSGHNMRTFEIPATKTLMIGDRTNDIEGWFPDTVASLTASTPAEFREKCQWALDHPNAALEIAKQAHSLVQNMTYQERADYLLRYLL